MPNIRDFAQQGLGSGLPPGLQPRRPQGFAPQQVNFGGQLQPPAQQQITESQILGQLLSGQLGGIPQDQGNAFGGLQNAIMQRGAQDAQQRQRDQAGIRQSANIPFAQSPIDPNALAQIQQSQGRNLRRF